MPPPTELDAISDEVAACRRCPRLVAWREDVAREKRAAFRDWDYWGRGVPGFGDVDARVVVVGLAPAAHGANRTGRMFTGDRSGEWLYGAMHTVGMASQATSTDRDDGLTLHDVWVTAVVRCAPPANRPTPGERDACLDYLARELDAMPRSRAIVALGAFAYESVCRLLEVRPRPRFTHGVEVDAPGGRVVLGAFHPSQRNTFTGKLRPGMLEDVLRRALELASR